MITKEEFMKSIKRHSDDEGFLCTYLILKGGSLTTMQYVYGDLEWNYKKHPDKTEDEVFTIVCEKMWEAVKSELSLDKYKIVYVDDSFDD